MSPTALFGEALRARAREALATCAARARREGQARYFAVAAEASAAIARAASEDDALMRRFENDEEAAALGGEAEARFALFQPERGCEWLARGEVVALEIEGAGRLTRLPAQVRALFERVDLLSAGDGEQSGAAPLRPQLVGGLGYDDVASRDPIWREHGAGCLWLPRELWRRRGAALGCVVALRVAPGERSGAPEAALLRALDDAFDRAEEALAGDVADPLAQADAAIAPEYCAAADRAHSDYCDGVARALDAIGRGEFEKVVLARSLRVRYANGPRYQCARLLRALRAGNPSSTVFAVARPRADATGESIFLGASPELLARVDNAAVETLALAGSAPRGRSPTEDDAFGNALLESKKQQAEHRAVVSAIRSVLDDVCKGSECAEAPVLCKLEGIQHLATPIRARLLPEAPGAEARGIVDLVARLHPTPAVCGAPREAAEAWIAEHEALERGWYAGPVGVADGQGNGEFHVALRSGLVRGAEARLYAGAGIVEGSDPRAELAETRIKLRTLLAPLTEI